MANPNEFSQPVSFLNGGPFETTWGPYPTKEAACEALKNEVDADGKNMRMGKKVAIGTVTDYVEHAWQGGFENVNLKPYYPIPGNLATKEEFNSIYNNLPKTSVARGLPPVQNGYYKTSGSAGTIGAFFAAGGYYSYTLLLSEYQPPIYVTGRIKDAGTALAFYYDKDGNFISFELRGTAVDVNLTKYKLTIPINAVKVNITVLASGGEPLIFTESLSVNSVVEDLDKITSVLPKDKIEMPLPSPSDGYLRYDNGVFVATSAYKTYYLESFPEVVYISGTMKDAGTALAFYFNSTGGLISKEFQGTVNGIVYDKQKLNIPSGTARIGIVVLAAAGSAKIYKEELNNYILSQSSGDSRYLTQTNANGTFVPLNRIPASPVVSGDINYNNTVFSELDLFTGDTASARYINAANQITKAGCTLKKIRVKVAVNTQIVIYAVSISYINGTLTVTNLHQYANIPVVPETEEYTVNDSFILPLYSHLAIGDTVGRIYYKGSGGNGFRLNTTATTVAITFVRVAFNFTTSDSEPDTSMLITEKVANEKYQPKSGATSSGLLIAFPKQVKIKLAPTDKVLLWGTSISSTDYPWYKEAMELLTGAIVYNGGFSGAGSTALASNTSLQRIWDYGAKLVVIEIGANDTGSVNTVGTFGAIAGEPKVPEISISGAYNGTYFIQAVSYAIRRFKAQYENIRERANLTGSETEAEKTAKIDAVLKPYLVMTTGLPQKRTDANSAHSNPANWIRKRDAIIECCNKYNIHCIDLLNLIGWNMEIEPYWISPTNKITNNGVKTMDGLHPNKYGYNDMAQVICGGIGII